jgi:hypothetical protein
MSRTLAFGFVERNTTEGRLLSPATHGAERNAAVGGDANRHPGHPLRRRMDPLTYGTPYPSHAPA